MVKAMPVFRYFDYGHSAEFVRGKKGDAPTSCKIMVYPRDKKPVNFITTHVESAEPHGGTSTAGSNLVARDQDVTDRRPPEIIPT